MYQHPAQIDWQDCVSPQCFMDLTGDDVLEVLPRCLSPLNIIGLDPCASVEENLKYYQLGLCVYDAKTPPRNWRARTLLVVLNLYI